MGCSVKFIEQHYDSARVENMMNYITRTVDKDDAFEQYVLAQSSDIKQVSVP